MRLLTTLTLVLALTSVSSARTPIHPAQGPILGGPGTDILYGTDGPTPDYIDPGTGTDQVCDSSTESRADGTIDTLHTIDGEHDIVIAGPEDILRVDDVDLVIIRDSDGNVLFSGFGNAYKFWEELMWWLDQLYNNLLWSIDDLWDYLVEQFAVHGDDDTLHAAFQGAIDWVAQLEDAPTDEE